MVNCRNGQKAEMKELPGDPWFVYILRCADASLYTGITKDVNRSKRSFVAALDELPDGVFVTVPAWGEQANLVWGGRLLAWSPGGYGERRPRPKDEEVMVLTPQSTVGVIRAGYALEIHRSAVGDT